MPSIEASSSQLPIANGRAAGSSSCCRSLVHYRSQPEAVHAVALAGYLWRGAHTAILRPSATVEGQPVDNQAGELMADITVTQEH